METRIWNTFADDQEVFHIRVYTVLVIRLALIVFISQWKPISTQQYFSFLIYCVAQGQIEFYSFL